jgi:3'(2'), 5'-bisphosphate nucleotidase
MNIYSNIIPSLVSLCYLAGEKIMEVYEDEVSWDIEEKNDKSPLTKADKESHLIIMNGLQSLPEKFPIISEEGKNIPYEERKNWDTFWLVDPLDGTKEFIKRNGQFTVNISLIKAKKPVLGIIYAPATKELYYGLQDEGSFKIVAGEKKKISVSQRKTDLIAVGSSSHASEQEAQHLAPFAISETIKSGSSLKFCLVAEGKADIYLRTGPTMEWDTAAGHCIAECAGASMTTLDYSIFEYNKESLLNGGFVCKAC